MKNVFEHIETVKGKPHHVKRRVAYGTALGGAALVGVIWLGISLNSGAYAIKGANFAQATGYEPTPGAASVSTVSTSQVAGAASALDNQQSAPAHIEIIDAATTSSANPASPTVIPF